MSLRKMMSARGPRPATKPKSKKKAQRKAGIVMKEFYHGKLHSGSKHGPVVTNPAQAKAIAMSEAGLSKKKRKKK